MFICSSESDGIEELISKDTLELLIKGYGQEAYSRSSGNKSFYIPKVNINILVAAQPTFITKIISSEKLLSKGLPARWIILLNESIHTIFIPDNIMEIKKNFYYSINKFIKMFYTHSVNSKKFDVEVSQEGYSILSEFQEELKNNALDQSLKSWIAKLPGKAVRIALALHAWRHKDKLLQHHINKEDMKYAVYLAKVALSHAKFIFSPNGYLAQVNAIKIYESLLRITSDTERISLLRQGINSTELAQRTKLRKNEIIPALQFLESCNLIATWDDGGSKIHVVPRYDFFQNICV